MSLFRSEVPRSEKKFLAAFIAWTVLVATGGIYYFIRDFHFGPEPQFVSWILGLSLLVGFLCCLALFRNRDPENRFVRNPFLVQIGLFAGLLILFASLAWGTYFWVVGPFVTSSFGTASSETYVVTEKSSGLPNRRSCNHFVWLRDTDSRWRAKACLRRELWSAVQAGDTLIGVGHNSILGRTLEQLESVTTNVSQERARE